MIVATVTTCPKRWNEYQRFRRNFEALELPFPVRTFQCAENLELPFVNHVLNARAALQFAANRLGAHEENWMMYLEEDVRLTPDLAAQLAALLDIGGRERVDCWYLCNRKNPVARSFKVDGLLVNELAEGACGSHALLLPQRHLRAILNMHWGDLADRCIFRALGADARIWQVVSPVLAEHTGEISTFNPEARQKLEINVCN